MRYKIGDKVRILEDGLDHYSKTKKGDIVTVERLYLFNDNGFDFEYNGVRHTIGKSNIYKTELVTPKFGDPCWVNGEPKCYLGLHDDDLHYYCEGEPGSMAGNKIKSAWIDDAITFTEPELEIELTVNGKAVTISEETLKAIKEAL